MGRTTQADWEEGPGRMSGLRCRDWQAGHSPSHPSQESGNKQIRSVAGGPRKEWHLVRVIRKDLNSGSLRLHFLVCKIAARIPVWGFEEGTLCVLSPQHSAWHSGSAQEVLASCSGGADGEAAR